MAIKRVCVGNTYRLAGSVVIVTQEGEATFAAKVTASNPTNQTYNEWDLVLGEVTEIDIELSDTVMLILAPLQGNELATAKYGRSTTIPISDPQQISYEFTTNQKNYGDQNSGGSPYPGNPRSFTITTIEATVDPDPDPDPDPELWYTLTITPNLAGKVTAKLVDENEYFIKDLPIGEPFAMTSNDHYVGDLRGYSIILTPVGGAEITGTSSNWTFDPIYQTNYYFEPMAGATNGEWIKRGLNVDYERSGNYTIEVELLAEVPDTVAPFNRLYLVDTETMHELTNIDLHLPDEEINRTDFMINLLQVPFELPNEVIGAESGIVIGDLETAVTAPVILSDVINIPLGEIEIVSGESSLDYSNENQYELVLPFIESVISLNPNQVLGNTIRVEYSLDGYNGDLTVNLFNGESETPFITNKAATGREIPIKLRSEYALAIGRMLGVDNGTLKAYIRALKPELTAGQYSNLVEVFGNLSEVKGYIEVSKIDLRSGRATLGDKESIIGLLSSGVIINE